MHRYPPFLRKSLLWRIDPVQWVLAGLSMALLIGPMFFWHLPAGRMSLVFLVLTAVAAVLSGVFPVLLGLALLLFTIVGICGIAFEGVSFLQHPFFSQVAAQGEYAMPAVLLCWAVTGALLSWYSRMNAPRRLRRLVRKSELTASIYLRRWGGVYAIALPLLTLLCIWAAPWTPSADGGYSALFGQLPWSDARGYFEGGQRLLSTGRLDDWDCHRPVNIALLTGRLALAGGSAHGATILQVLLLGASIYFCARAIGSELGIWAGVCSYAFIWCWSRGNSPTTMTETLGISIGALSFGLLFIGMRRKAILFLLIGLSGMAFAQSARLGALVILPSLALWVGWHYREQGIAVTKYLAVSILALALGFSINYVLVSTYGNRNAQSVGSNFAAVLHGLAAGSPDGWAHYTKFDELRQLPEAEQNRRLYHDAWEMIRHDPTPFIRAAWQYNLRPFLHGFGNEVFSGFHLWSSNIFNIRTITWIVIALGLLKYFLKEKAKGDLWFWLAGGAGILLSVPIIYQSSGWRAMAATYPWLACLLSGGLSVVCRRRAMPQPVRPEWCASGLLVMLAILSISGPVLAMRLPSRSIPASLAVSDNEAVIAGGNTMRSTAVLSGTKSLRGVASFDDATLRSLLKTSGMEIWEELDTRLPRMKPYLLGVQYDYSRKRSIYVIAPPELLKEDGRYLRLQLLPLKIIERSLHRDQGIFEVTAWSRIRSSGAN